MVFRGGDIRAFFIGIPMIIALIIGIACLMAGCNPGPGGICVGYKQVNVVPFEYEVLSKTYFDGFVYFYVDGSTTDICHMQCSDNEYNYEDALSECQMWYPLGKERTFLQIKNNKSRCVKPDNFLTAYGAGVAFMIIFSLLAFGLWCHFKAHTLQTNKILKPVVTSTIYTGDSSPVSEYSVELTISPTTTPFASSPQPITYNLPAVTELSVSGYTQAPMTLPQIQPTQTAYASVPTYAQQPVYSVPQTYYVQPQSQVPPQQLLPQQYYVPQQQPPQQYQQQVYQQQQEFAPIFAVTPNVQQQPVYVSQQQQAPQVVYANPPQSALVLGYHIPPQQQQQQQTQAPRPQQVTSGGIVYAQVVTVEDV